MMNFDNGVISSGRAADPGSIFATTDKETKSKDESCVDASDKLVCVTDHQRVTSNNRPYS